MLDRHIQIIFFLYVLLGGLPQLKQVQLNPSFPYSYPQDTRGMANLFRYNAAAELYVYGSRYLGELKPDGLFRFYRKYSDDSAFTTVITSDYAVPIDNGKVYTQSIYFRSDNPNLVFDLTFWTRRGRQAVSTVIEDVGGGLKRAYATYQARPGDDLIQGPDLINFRGVWRYIDIGYAQLEVGSAPSHILGGWPNSAGWERFLWWIGTALLGWMVLYMSKHLFPHIDGFKASLMIVIGFIVHVGIGVEQYLSDNLRATGLTVNPNAFGASSVVVAGLTWLIGDCRLAIPALGVMISAVWISGSRAAFLGALFLGMIWIKGLPLRWKWVTLTLLFLSAALAVGLGWGDHLGRFSSIVDISSPSSQSRLEIWRVAWQAFMEHPLTGVGANRFEIYYLEHRPIDALEPVASHAHNLFLHLLAEMGLLGLSGFLMLWGYIIWKLWQLRELRVLTVISGALIVNLFDYTWFYAGVYYPLWVAVAWALRTPSKPELPSPDTMRG